MRESEENKKSWLISSTNPWRKKWDYAIIIAAMVSVAFIPVRIALNKSFGGVIYFMIDIFSYIMYCADIFISLRTTYIDSFGEEIKDNRLIIRRYLQSPSFWIDLLSLLNVPSNNYSENMILPLFGILKVMRITRLQKLITQSHFQKGYKVLLKIIYHFVIFMVYLHVAGCLWFVIIETTYKKTLEHSEWCYDIDADYGNYKSILTDPGTGNINYDIDPEIGEMYDESYRKLQYFCNWFDEDDTYKPKPPEEFGEENYIIVPWIPPYDFYDGTDNFWVRYRAEEQSFMYLVCLYYSVLVIGGNELGPKELNELIFMVVLNLTGAIVQAYIFGELAVLIGQVDRSGSQE